MRGVVVAVALGLALLAGPAPSAAARPRVDRGVLGQLVGEQWRVLLEIPGSVGDDQHPFNVGGCLRYDHVVTPSVGIGGATEVTCRTRFGEPVYVVARSFEASIIEVPAGGDTSRQALEGSALAQLGAARPLVCYDGRRLPLVKAVSGLVHVDLPQPNLFDATTTASTDLVAAGYVTVVVPPPGRHVITIEQADGSFETTNTIIVGHRRQHRAEPAVATAASRGRRDRACSTPSG